MMIPTSELSRLENNRPGFTERLIAAGKVSNGILEISESDYLRVTMEQVEQTVKSIYYRPEISRGPGDVFALIIRRITGESMCKRCRTRAEWMNKQGWLQCWIQRKKIIGWLYEEARSRGHDLPQDTAGALFKAALKELLKIRKQA